MNSRGSGLAKVTGVLGWLAVMGGLTLAGFGTYQMVAADTGSGPAIMTLVGGALTAAFGLLAVLNSIMAAAMIDTANAMARLLAAGGTSAATVATASAVAADAIPDFSASREDAFTATDTTGDSASHDEPDSAPYENADDVPELPPFDTAPAAPVPPAAPIVPDASDPRLWPLAIDEFDLDGHLAMTLEDGTIAVETSEGWRRLSNIEDARTWLSQGI